MHRLLLPAILAGCLLAPLATQAEARPIVIVERGWHHGGPWGGPRWGSVVAIPAPWPVLLPPVVVPQFIPIAVPQPVAVAVPRPVAGPVPVVPAPSLPAVAITYLTAQPVQPVVPALPPSGCGCPQ